MATEQVFELNSKKRIIINHLKQLPGLMAVFVHGSVAKGTEHLCFYIATLDDFRRTGISFGKAGTYRFAFHG